MKFTIKGKLPSLNEYIEVERSHRNAGAGLRKRLMNQISKEIIVQKVPVSRSYPVSVRCVYFEKDRRRDIDNIVWAKKIIGDALVKTQRIKDDNQKHLNRWIDEVKLDPKDPRIEVEIIEPETKEEDQ